MRPIQVDIHLSPEERPPHIHPDERRQRRLREILLREPHRADEHLRAHPGVRSGPRGWDSRSGSKSPVEDTHALFAGLHDLASLTISGRANIHGKPGADEAIARATARRLVRAIVPER
ncbi:MAG: hypothetical protein QM820_00280 [Minicystis sp.]